MGRLQQLHHAFSDLSTILPLFLFGSSSLAFSGTAQSPSLSIYAIAWSLVCVLCTLRLERVSTRLPRPRASAWAAGILLALAQSCEQAAEQDSIWWAKVNIVRQATRSSD